MECNWVVVYASGNGCIIVAAGAVGEGSRTGFAGEGASQCKYNVVADLIYNVVATIVGGEYRIVSRH